MPPQSEFRYAVLLRSPQDLKPKEIAETLSAVRRVPWQDVMPAAKRCWGIAADDLEKADAEEIARGLEGRGVRSIAIPSNLIEDLPPFRQVARLDWAADGLRVPPREEGPKITGEEDENRPEPQRVVWERIQLIAAGGYMQTPPEGKPPRSSAKAARGRRGAREPETPDVVFYLELFLRDPLLRLRIDAQKFDYSFLKERMQYAVFVNFLALVKETVGRAPGAMRSRGTEIISAERPFREMGYESLADLERESRWLLTLATLKLH